LLWRLLEMASTSFQRSAAFFAVILVAMVIVSATATAAGQKRGKTKKAKIVKAQKPKPVIQKRDCSVQSELTTAEQEAILADHNQARKALNLPSLKWDCGLASLAQSWANAGKFRHRDDPSMGENLFVSNNAAEPIATVVPDWLDEKPNYNTKSGDCLPDTVCTHYSQIVWRETTLIGCGINRHLTDKWLVFVVCNYSPAGNTGGPAY